MKLQKTFCVVNIFLSLFIFQLKTRNIIEEFKNIEKLKVDEENKVSNDNTKSTSEREKALSDISDKVIQNREKCISETQPDLETEFLNINRMYSICLLKKSLSPELTCKETHIENLKTLFNIIKTSEGLLTIGVIEKTIRFLEANEKIAIKLSQHSTTKKEAENYLNDQKQYLEDANELQKQINHETIKRNKIFENFVATNINEKMTDKDLKKLNDEYLPQMITLANLYRSHNNLLACFLYRNE